MDHPVIPGDALDEYRQKDFERRKALYCIIIILSLINLSFNKGLNNSKNDQFKTTDDWSYKIQNHTVGITSTKDKKPETLNLITQFSSTHLDSIEDPEGKY